MAAIVENWGPEGGRPRRAMIAETGRVALVLASLLGVLVVLRAAGVTTLLAWTLPVIEDARYPLLFAAYFATWWFARRASGDARRTALLGGSIATAAIFDATFLALSLVWICGLHLLLRRWWVALAYVVATYVIAVAIACVGLHTDVRKMAGLGWKPLVVALAASAAVGVVSGVLVTAFGSLLSF